LSQKVDNLLVVLSVKFHSLSLNGLDDMRMRNVGFCGIDEITNSLGVIEDLERLSVDDRVPRDNNNNGGLRHSFSAAADEVFA